MSDLLNTLHDIHQQHKEGREERREARGERHGHYHNEQDGYRSQQSQRSYQDDDDSRRPQSYQPQSQGQGYGYNPPSGAPPSTYGSSGYRSQDGYDRGDYQRPYQGDDNARRPQTYQSQGQGYVAPSGPPPSARGPSPGFASQGGLDRSDFASDADIDRMVASGEFGRSKGPGGGYGSNLEPHSTYGRRDALSGSRPGQGYGERANEYARYDAPSGPPPSQGYQGQQSYEQSYGSGYGGGQDRPNQYGPPRGQGRTEYDAPQRPPQGYGGGNAPAGGYSASRPAEEKYGSGYGGPTNDRPNRSEAGGYYNQQGAHGGDDRYAHLANMAKAHGDDPGLYRQATQGLQQRIQNQAQSRPARRNDEDDDRYKTHVDTHQKAYGDEDHGPMDTHAIGVAAAMEAIKQTAAAAKTSNAPAGALKPAVGRPSDGAPGASAKPTQAAQEEDAAAAPGGGGGGLQDKLMALAMSQAGKLFDKKNAASGQASSGGDNAQQDKAQAMQSAAATAMQLFQQYQTKGKLDAGDMSKVMGLAMKMF